MTTTWRGPGRQLRSRLVDLGLAPRLVRNRAPKRCAFCRIEGHYWNNCQIRVRMGIR